MSLVELSVYEPIATILLFLPIGISVSGGFIEMETSVADVTVMPALPMAPVTGSIAVITVSPSVAPFTLPFRFFLLWAIAI